MTIEQRQRWEAAAQGWGQAALTELVLGAKARGIVRRQHFEEARRSAKLAARYALRALEMTR